jgi:hypothetical protein
MALLTFDILSVKADFDVGPDHVGPSIHIKALADDEVQVATYEGELLSKSPWQFLLQPRATEGAPNEPPEDPVGQAREVLKRLISGRVELPRDVFNGLLTALFAGALFESLSIEVNSSDNDDDDRVIWDRPSEDALEIVSICVTIKGKAANEA